MKKITLSVICVLSLVTVRYSYADPVSVNPRPRMQSMGGAGLSAGGDKDSAMLNPAALSDIKSSYWSIMPLLFEAPFEMDAVQSAIDYKDAIDAATTNNQKKTALQTFLTDVSTTALMTRVNFYPSYTRPHFHAGILMDFLVDAKLRAGGATSNQVVNLGNSAGTTGLILAGSYDFLDDRLHVGLTLKPLYKFSVMNDSEQTLRDILVGKNPDANGNDTGIKEAIIGENFTDNKAFGIGVDLGLRYDLPFVEAIHPQVGVTYQDIGDTRFLTDHVQPMNIPQSVSAGMSIQPDFGIFRNTVAIDFRNLTEAQELLNMLHIGAESVIWNFLALRAGLGQGYFSTGVGIDLKIFELDAYLSSREASRYAHLQSQTVIGLRLALGF